jgi:hypothetical protein
MLEIKYEYLNNNYFGSVCWIEIPLLPKVLNDDFVWRKTEYYDKYWRRTVYYKGFMIHRLDGPAIYYPNQYQLWYVNGKELCYFNDCVQSHNIKESIFRFVKEYPEHVFEIIILATHNKWLNEKELKLLTCLDMFK